MEHTIKRGEYLSLTASNYKLTLNQLLSAIPRYKADVVAKYSDADWSTMISRH